MKKLFFFIFLLAVASVTDADAQRKAGRNGGVFLEIGVGAREVALGSAATSLNHDANAIFWNPAGTALTVDQTFSSAFSYNQWIADMDYMAAAVAIKAIGGTVAFGAQVLGVSDIAANRQNGYDDPILAALVTDSETAETYDFQDAAFSLAYSKYVLDRLSLGATVKFINESIDGESASAFAFDFGSVYDVGVYGWSLAARINNLGSEMSYFNQDNPLPLVFSIGSTIHPVSSEEYDLMLAVDATKAMDSEQHVYGGAELGFYDLLFVRAGYKYNYSGSSDDGTSFRDPIDTTIEGFSAGAGIQYDLQTANVAVDYAYTQMELLDAVNRITLRISR